MSPAAAISPRDSGSAGLEPTFSPTLRFTCTRCGACCRHVGAGVGLTGGDVARLGMEVGPGSGHPVFVDALESVDGVCSHLSGRDCSVYIARPLMCRLYPFYIGVKADGTLQLSVDHCPGVDLPDAELIDESYVQREIAPALTADPAYLASLRAQVMARKGDTYHITDGSAVEVRVTWRAREWLWAFVFSVLEERLPDSFSPRDRMECLKADLATWIEGLVTGLYGGEVLDQEAIWRRITEREDDLSEALASSAAAQEEHRSLIQLEGQVSAGTGGEFTTFQTRTGESFEVGTHDVLRLREIAPEATRAEMAFLREVVRREFVYQGVVVPSLTLREEASLLFYIADSAELIANAAAIHSGKERVGIEEMNSAICEADSHILTTVQGLGVQIPTDWSAG